MCAIEAFKRLELLLRIKFCGGQMVQTWESFFLVMQQPGDPADGVESRLPLEELFGKTGQAVVWKDCKVTCQLGN